jgi:cell division protein FtsW
VLGAVALLLIVGLMMVLSASSVNAYVTYGDSYFYVKRQVVFLVVGVIGAIVIMKLPSSALRMLGWFGSGLAAVLLILTYTPLGITVNGNRNWLYLGSSLFAIQPAEFAKLAIVIWGAPHPCPETTLARPALASACPVPAGHRTVDLVGALPG